MKSLKELYRIGHGPSSSHSMGPAYAAEELIRRVPDMDGARVVLYGSLAKTGRGHRTDNAIKTVLAKRGITDVEIIFDTETDRLPHENTLDLTAMSEGRAVYTMRAMSVGGGAVRIAGEDDKHGADGATSDVYPERSFFEIATLCKKEGMRLSDYVFAREGDAIRRYLSDVWDVMNDAVTRGLEATGTLGGGLGVERKARHLYNSVGGESDSGEREAMRECRIVCAYAFAAAEENADGGIVVTAPTCGASGVVPAVMRYYSEMEKSPREDIIRALASAGVIGNVVKTNASISGAECGCQAEIGTATSMAAAAVADICGMTLDQIEYAAEIAMEHQLGLTCDPIAGLVQIPCIERNAVAAMRAVDSAMMARYLSDVRKISFDLVTATMYETGRDLNSHYRETAEGGLAKLYK